MGLLRIPESGRRLHEKKTDSEKKRYLACTGRKYQGTIRRFLKGDGGMLQDFLYCQRTNPENHGQINFLASYDGFRLADIVSYEKKQNQAKREDNRDGENVQLELRRRRRDREKGRPCTADETDEKCVGDAVYSAGDTVSFHGR